VAIKGPNACLFQNFSEDELLKLKNDGSEYMMVYFGNEPVCQSTGSWFGPVKLWLMQK
jgi:hypothetical protein